MPKIQFISMSTAEAEGFWRGAKDAYGRAPEIHISKGDGVPCRHCQEDVAKGEKYLALSYCPFPALQPFAETGPIFLHAEPCARYPENDVIPAMVLKRESFLLKGYNKDNRIVYGTGEIAKSPEMVKTAEKILQNPDVAYVHVRSALNNCFTCRIDRA